MSMEMEQGSMSNIDQDSTSNNKTAYMRAELKVSADLWIKQPKPLEPPNNSAIITPMSPLPIPCWIPEMMNGNV